MATSISKIYTHRVLKSEQIVEMLKNRGLAFADEVAAIAFLKDVSYFRLAAYLRPMEADKSTHVFKPNTSFFNTNIENYKEIRYMCEESRGKSLIL